ncbi:MAG: hypothetical protein R3C19_00600 [Planctomycetaceae bacterium]
MNRDPVSVQRIQWNRVCPGLLLLKAPAAALSVQALIPALCCLLICSAGRMVLAHLLGEPANPDAISSPDRVGDWTNSIRQWLPAPLQTILDSAWSLLVRPTSDPVRNALALVWHAAVVGLTGVAVARSTAASVCRQNRLGVIPSVQFSAKNCGTLLTSTTIAAAFVAGLLLICHIARWTRDVAAVGELIVSIALPLVLLAVLCLEITAMLCLTGWFLALAAIGTDQCDGSDALSRGISYVVSHPIAALCCALATACLMAAFGLAAEFVFHAADAVLNGIFTGISWQSKIAEQVTDFWRRIWERIPEAYRLAIFYCGTTITYLVLRHREDGISLDEMDGGQPGNATV